MRISASAPTRIDLAGGTIDIWPLYLFHSGAQTLHIAISLRAHAWIEPRPDDRIELISEDTDRMVNLPAVQLRSDETLPLLGRLAHRFGAHGLRLTTRGESPAGAGIAGSSALNIAICGALARFTHQELDPETLMDVAKDVEAQVIHVPTGLQDYRPAMYGGIAALELEAGRAVRVALDVDPSELQQRLVLCYTGEPRNS
ncbi:MAG: GHMP kinase, partial [Acidobacteriota bacterium]|nr:GHMP kinase [Acidobacteriota bacterium]